MRLPVLLIAAMALVVLAAGCEGGGGGGTNTSEATTGAHEATTGSGEAGGTTTAESGEGSGKPKASGEGEGEGGAEEPATGARPSAQFVNQINAMCGRVQEGLSEAVEEYEQEHEGGTEKVEGELGAQAVAATIDSRFEAMIGEVRELGEQNGEGEAVEPYLEALEDAISSSQEPTALAQVGRAFVPADKLARVYGLKSCIAN